MLFFLLIYFNNHPLRRSQWPRGLRRRSSAARLLRLWVRIPPGAWMFVCCECCVLSGRGLCDGLITRPEKSYRLWCVVVCDQETSNEEAKAHQRAVENTATMVVTPGKQKSSATCFEQINHSSSGGILLYMPHMVFIMLKIPYAAYIRNMQRMIIEIN